MSRWRAALRRLSGNPSAVVGAVIVGGFLLVALFAGVLAPHSPYREYLISEVRLGESQIPGPRSGFPLGADERGRDLLSRLIYGSRQTLFVGVVATLIGLVAGVALGAVAAGGRSGSAGRAGPRGWVDVVVMRIVDVALSLPGLLLAISLAALVGHASQWTVIGAVAATNVPVFARLLRGCALAQLEREHVLAARALGVKQRWIVLRHVLPHALSPVLAQATLTLATAILDAAALSFLGLGDPDPARAEWGLMLGDGQRFFEIRPELAYYPALAIIVVALGFMLLGEAMREAIDPRNR